MPSPGALRVVFLGAGAFGLPSLERLIGEHDVITVVTQPDRRAGRGRSLRPTPVADLADLEGIPSIRTADVNAPEIVEQVADLRPDALVVIAFGQKLGGPLIGERFAINLHGSLLPKYRGAAPINWAMINGEDETGVSVITLADRMDAGSILAQAATAILPHETAGELHDRLALIGAPLVLRVLDAHRAGTLQPVAQDERLATKAPKLKKSDGSVRFDRPAEQVRQRVHGLTPWPGCTVLLAGEPVRLCRVAEVAGDGGAPGDLHGDGTVVCSPGAVQLLEVQPASGRNMGFAAYSNGRDLPPDARIEPA